MRMTSQKRVLFIIVFAQFCCTSLWFAGNGVINDLVNNFDLPENALGHLTSIVQFGFISGTLLFALLTIADRYSPSKVFMTCAVIASLFNLGTIWEGNGLTTLLIFRFFTGFFLAGIYPVGMKIAADYFEKGLGKSLGFLVGALVIGTGFPHLLKGFTEELPWKIVLLSTSGLALLGGLLMILMVPDGPFRKASQKLDLSALFKVFRRHEFRSPAFGYFGHMWELYAFWAFVPKILEHYKETHTDSTFSIPVMSFLIIGIGGISCVIGGYLSMKWGAKKIAVMALTISCGCCLFSPFILINAPLIAFFVFLFIWGSAVIADSPLFSTLVAQNAEVELKGTALTVVNFIGFSITILSIQLLNYAQGVIDPNYIYLLLAIGPILGLTALTKKART